MPCLHLTMISLLSSDSWNDFCPSAGLQDWKWRKICLIKSDGNNQCKLQWGAQRIDIFCSPKLPLRRIILEVSVLVEAVSHVSDILKFCLVNLSENELFSNQRTPCCSVYSLLLVKKNNNLQTALEYVMVLFLDNIFKVFVCAIACGCCI